MVKISFRIIFGVKQSVNLQLPDFEQLNAAVNVTWGGVPGVRLLRNCKNDIAPYFYLHSFAVKPFQH